MQIKLSFNYRWICARTPHQCLKPCAPGRAKSWLVTCLGLSCACACRLCSSCVVRQSSPTTEIQAQLSPCEPAFAMSPSPSGGVTQGSANIPPVRGWGSSANRKADELGNWACKSNVDVCQLVFPRRPNLEKVFLLWKPVPDVTMEFKEITTVTSPDRWLLLLFLMAPSLPLLCPTLENMVAFSKQMWAIARAHRWGNPQSGW